MGKARKLFVAMVKNASLQDINKIGDALFSMNRGKIAKIWDKVMELWSFAKDPHSPWTGKVIAIAALVYLITPTDAIPDWLWGLGLIDDASIIAYAIKKLSSDYKEYMKKVH